MHVSLWVLFHQIQNVNMYPLLPSSFLLFHQVHIVQMYRALKMPFQVVFANKHEVAIVKWAGYWSLGAFASVIKSGDLIKNRPFGFTATLGWSTYPLWLFQSVPLSLSSSFPFNHSLPDETFHDCHVLTCKGILCHILQNCTCTEYCAHATIEYGSSCLHSKRTLWVQTIDQPPTYLPRKMFDRNQAMHKEQDLVWCVYV